MLDIDRLARAVDELDDRMAEQEKVSAVMAERMETMCRKLDDVRTGQKEMKSELKSFLDSRPCAKNKADIDSLKEWRLRLDQRTWDVGVKVGIPLVLSAVGGALTYFVVGLIQHYIGR